MFYDNHVITSKRGEKDLHFWSTHYVCFENIVVLSISRKTLQTPPSDDILEVNFTWSNSITLVEDLIKWKAGFERFLIDHYAIDTGNKILLVRNKKYLYQRHPPYTIRVSPHWMRLMEACLEVNIPMFYFYHLKIPSKIMKNVFDSFNSISLDSLKKSTRQQIYETNVLDETKLIYWSTGPTDSILSKRKNDVTKFWPTGFF